MPEDTERKFTAADVDAIVTELERRALERFQKNVGRGVLSLLTKWVIRAVVAVALYGAGSTGLLRKLGL